MEIRIKNLKDVWTSLRLVETFQRDAMRGHEPLNRKCETTVELADGLKKGRKS